MAQWRIPEEAKICSTMRASAERDEPRGDELVEAADSLPHCDGSTSKRPATLQKGAPYASGSCQSADLAFPDAYYAPPLQAKRCVVSCISATIGHQLRRPIIQVALRHAPTPRTAVPEATVNKDRDFVPRPTEVRSPGQCAMAPPAAEALLSEDFNQGQLCGSVSARSVGGHAPMARHRAQRIGHPLVWPLDHGTAFMKYG
jgi:hypothetical protein